MIRTYWTVALGSFFEIKVVVTNSGESPVTVKNISKEVGVCGWVG